MSEIHALEATADEIEATRPAEVKIPPRSGLERGGDPTRYDPATVLGEPKTEASKVLPSTRSGAGGSSNFVHSDAVSSAHHRAREAARVGSLEGAQTVSPTKRMTAAWAAVEKAWSAAEEAVRAVPIKVAEAARERAQKAAESAEPVALPTVADVRAHHDAKALAACRAVVDARAKYDTVVDAEREAHLEHLASSVPEDAAALRSSVDDLRGRLERLRVGVDALVERAASTSPSVVRAKMPARANLDALDDLVTEVEALLEVSENPTRPRLVPSLEERHRIAAGARHMPGGFTQEFIALAVREHEEKGAHTRLAASVPAFIRESYARDGFWRA